jgi:hypothetical protein
MGWNRKQKERNRKFNKRNFHKKNNNTFSDENFDTQKYLNNVKNDREETLSKKRSDPVCWLVKPEAKKA